MPIEIKVPELGESVVEATVGRWLKKEGDPVKVGEAIVEIETDKVNLEVGAEKDGVLARIQRQQGEDVKVGEVLGVLDETAQAAWPTSPPTPLSASREGETASAAVSAPSQEGVSKAPEASHVDERITPLAKRVAESNAVDLSQVTPSGPGGRVTRGDVERHLAKGEKRDGSRTTSTLAPVRATQTMAAVQPKPVRPERYEERVRMSRRRRTIAQRLVEAQHNAAMLTTFNEVDMSSVMDIRQRHKESFKEKNGIGLGIASFFVKATIGALKDFPRLNAEIDGDDMIIKHYYDIGMAVGAEEGLVVPVLRDAGTLSFAEIERKIKEFAQQAREGTLALEDLRGGTFTITNGGVYGSLMSTPILNPPQVGILGLHTIKERPVIVNGAIVARPMMYIALSYDHRIVDGQEAVQFLVRVKELIEDPSNMLLS
jgi:2-oxoglutarate dehydrogenase E2 component (dihydrolipoamide succinyltransferase)